MAIERELIDFLSQKYSVAVDEDTSLIDSGLLDSIVLLEVVNFIEKQAGARIPDDAVTHENFETVSSMARLYRELTAGDAPAAPA